MSAADDLRALSAAATPGPWEAPFGILSLKGDWPATPEDIVLIMWCRNHADALADLIDAARYIRTTGHGEKLTDMTTCRCGDPHPCPVLRTHDAIAALDADRG